MADLDQQMRTVLMRLALVSNGSTATMDANRGGGSARYYEDVIPAGAKHHAHEHFQDKYNAAATRAEREIVYEDARAVLEEITHARHPVIPFETPEEKRAWIVEHCEGLTQQQAANRVSVSVRTVYSARVAAGREPDFGRQTDTVRYDSVAERKRYVRDLAQEGMSARSIAKVLSVSYNTVRRDLGRRA
jgi:predicted DNA-binding protein (UPF0251 family)